MPNLPKVHRYNEWGLWKPLDGRPPSETHVAEAAIRELASPASQAVMRYYQYTGHCGIEFVMLSLFRDPITRVLPSGLIAYPCFDTKKDIHSGPPAESAPWYIYDCWLPLAEPSAAAIVEGLQTVEQAVALMAYVHAVPTRWIVKYSKPRGLEISSRYLTDEDNKELIAQTTGFATLPTNLRNSVAQAMQWAQHAEQSLSPIERYLSTYYGLECLCLALWEAADNVGLPLANSTEPKKVRRAREADEIKQLLANCITADPVAAVTEAYFRIVVPIRRRTESVLRALAGPESDFPTWLHGQHEVGFSPASLRSGLVHGRLSGSALDVQRALAAFQDRLTMALRSTIARIIYRSWLGAEFPIRRLTYYTTIPLDDLWLADPPSPLKGDFRITLGMLVYKGLL